MILILATTLCLVTTSTQSPILNGNRLSPDLDEGLMEKSHETKVVGTNNGKWKITSVLNLRQPINSILTMPAASHGGGLEGRARKGFLR